MMESCKAGSAFPGVRTLLWGLPLHPRDHLTTVLGHPSGPGVGGSLTGTVWAPAIGCVLASVPGCSGWVCAGVYRVIPCSGGTGVWPE